METEEGLFRFVLLHFAYYNTLLHFFIALNRLPLVIVLYIGVYFCY